MTRDPSGSIALAVDAVRNMVADSQTFRALPSTPLMTHPAAKARVYWEDLPPPADAKAYTKTELQTYRPFAVVEISKEEGLSFETDADDTWHISGSIIIHIERTVSDVTARNVATADAQQEWCNLVGRIIDELKAMVHAGNPIYARWQFSSIRILAGPSQSHPDDAVHEGVSQSVVLVVEI